jgi:DNA-binding transcriptional LysR family regulator
MAFILRCDNETTMANFSNIDLNLLRVFDALFEERSVTRAGSRLRVTQSAVSHALARLRDILDDELFIKSPDGMTPTAKARAVGPRLRAGLLQLQAALTVDAFDPATAEYHYTIAADAYACAVLLPSVVGRIRADAPEVDVRITPGVADITEALDTGRVDLAISAYGRVPERLGLRELLRDRLVWVLRADHPLAQEPLTLERLAGLPHLVRAVTDERTEAMDGMIVEHGLERRVAQDGDGALVDALADIGRQRQVRLTVPSTHAALAVVGETDLAALVPWRMATAWADHYRLKWMEPPYPGPETQLSMVWHLGHGSDPALKWLRDIIAEVASQV